MKTSYTIKNFAKRVMMAITIVLFAGNAWGANKTGTLDMSKSQTSPVTNNGVTFTWTSANIVTSGSSGFKNSSSMTITIPTGTTLVSISKTNHANTWGGSASISVYAGSTNSGTKIATIVTGTNSYTISSNNTGNTYFFENNSGGNAWITGLSITYYEVSDPHTVNFSVTSGTPASTSLTEASGDAGIVLPNVTPDAAVTAAGWGFYGWAEATVGTETTTAPTIVGKAGETYYPEANITLYAVYAKGEYTKVTSTSEITSGGNYLIAGFDNNNNKMYVMTDNYYYDEDDTEAYYLSGYLLGTSPSNTYSPADINANWVCSIVINSNKYYIKNKENKYIDVDLSNWITSYYYSSDDYTFIYGDNGYCTIKNNFASKYLVVYVGGDFGRKTSEGWDKMLLYKETTTPKYVSAPCLNIVTLSAGTETNATISSFSDAGVQTCSSTAADRQVTITVAAATGYEFLSTARLTFAKTSGTATAEYVSGPTGTGPYTWVYQFSKDDSGAGTFSVTSATPKSYIITLNGNGATTDGTANVTATYNSATLSASITNPKKTHYMFQGWYSGSGGTGNLVINKDGELQANVAGYTGEGGVWTKDGATTLYAKWTEHSYTNYRTKCCDDPGLAFDGEYNYQTFVREDIKGAKGGNGSATEEQGKATLVLDYTTSSTGTCTVEVKKLTGADKRSTIAAGSDVSNHTGVSVDEENNKVTFEIWTYGSSYPTNNGQGTYRIKLSQESASTYCDVDTYYFVDVVLRDKFVDQVNGNATINKDGDGTTKTTPTEGDMDVEKNDDCHSTTRRLLGWIKETDLQTIYGTPRETGALDDASAYEANKSMVVAPGNSFTTSGVTWYAVWGIDNTPEP